MNRKTWFMTLLALFLTVLAIDYFFINVLFPSKKKAFLKRLFESSVELSYSLPLPPGLKTEFPPLALGQGDNFRETVAQCFQDKDLQNSKSPKDFLETLQKKFHVSKKIFHLEIIHFLNAKKEAMRIHVAPITADETQIREMQLFRVLDSGLPAAIAINPEMARNPTPEFLRDLFRDATVTFHQLRETILLGNNNIVLSEWLNGEITKLQTAADNKTFSCDVRTCTCK